MKMDKTFSFWGPADPHKALPWGMLGSPLPVSRKALSTLLQKSATVADNGETTVTVALFCDSVDRL